MTDWSLSRRRTLQLCSLGLAGAVAGCREAGPTGTDTTVESEPATDATTATATPTAVLSPAATDSGSPQPTATEQVPPGKLIAADGDGDDQFGTAVSLSGDRALVGAIRDEDPNGTWSGSAYVFRRSGGEWSQRAKLVPDDGGTYDRFGGTVALDGETALVGAFDQDNERGESAGAVYVFERTDSTWSQQTKLLLTDGQRRDRFGNALSLAGDRAVIGAFTDDPRGDNSGAAYVFQRVVDGWERRTMLTADDGDADDLFGRTVAQSGTTILVGAPDDEDPNGRQAGAAYVFERSEGAWSQRAKLTPEDGAVRDQFGEAIALDGTTALVGVESDDNASGTNAGAVYVFERTDGVWSQQATLLDASGGANQHLGDAVALAGDRALASTAESPPPDATHTHTDEETFATGAVVVYRRTDGGWRQARRLTAVDGDPGDHFGDTIAVAGGTALVGAVGDEDPNGDAAGSAYVYELTD